MAISDFDERLVILREGRVVPAPAYLLLLELERREFTVTREGASTLVVQPPERLTADDCQRIRFWKPHLLNLVCYCERPGLDAHLFRDDGGVERRVS